MTKAYKGFFCMTFIPDDSKEFVLSLRIKKSLLGEIDIAAQKERMNRSDYIRKAISDAISFSEIYRLNPTFLVNPDVFKFAIKSMEDIDLEELAALSMRNARYILKLYLQKNLQSSIVQKYLTNMKSIIIGLLTYIIQSILSPTGQHWFKRIHFAWETDAFVITGMHTLGLNFSKFMRCYFIQFFDVFGFKEQPSKQILHEDKLKLVFTGELKDFDIKTLLM